MRKDIQSKLKSNLMYIMYLHENSYWYKILNRNPDMINKFIEEVKTNYELRISDRINKAMNSFSVISSIISSLK